MENHPIPQDVTGFKFKLIGSITVKQFLYLLACGILATVSFLLFNKNPLLMVPSILFFAGIGFSLAFVPIEGRPMDVMLVNFARTIPSENRYIFRKRGANLASFKIFDVPVIHHAATATKAAQEEKNPANDKRALLISRLRNSSFRPDEGEVERLKNISSIFEDVKTTRVYTPVAAEKIEKEDLRQTQTQPQAPVAGTAGFQTLPDTPNVVMGRLVDSRGKVLPNILVEVLDSEDVPRRAFKTNAQGQFAAATPLADGTYKLVFTDPSKQHEFETKEITLDSKIFNPIETVSTDAREKLRRELFGRAATPA